MPFACNKTIAAVNNPAAAKAIAGTGSCKFIGYKTLLGKTCTGFGAGKGAAALGLGLGLGPLLPLMLIGGALVAGYFIANENLNHRIEKKKEEEENSY
ncbi:hypothetical protein MCHI_001957 [Candidatus Magnetoovum chiemensis]|nr:hypothetical protein MCHI_001957 [Candidatus Magnetoovum chiemensis]